MTNVRSYAFTITKNNPEETLTEFFDTTLSLLSPKWLVVQLERGESGTPHFQCALGFDNANTTAFLRKRMVRCHVERARNSAAAAAYCAKEDTRISGPLKHGTPPIRRNTKQGHAELNKRCLSEGVEALIADGTLSFKEYLRVKRGVEIYRQSTQHVDSNPELTNEWHCGPSGAGKSRHVRAVYGESLFNKAINKWYDGYAGQETVLLDDFGREHHVLGHYLK